MLKYQEIFHIIYVVMLSQIWSLSLDFKFSRFPIVFLRSKTKYLYKIINFFVNTFSIFLFNYGDFIGVLIALLITRCLNFILFHYDINY